MASSSKYIGDWDWAQLQYETTQRGCDEIAADIGTTSTALISRASRLGWSRNKAKGIITTAAAQALAAKATELEKYEVDKRTFLELQARVLVEHRQDIKKARQIAQKFFHELEQGSDELDFVEKTKVLRQLTESLKTQILLERQAFNISGPLEDPERAPMPQEEQDTRMAHVMAVFATALRKNAPKPEVIVVNDSRD